MTYSNTYIREVFPFGTPQSTLLQFNQKKKKGKQKNNSAASKIEFSPFVWGGFISPPLPSTCALQLPACNRFGKSKHPIPWSKRFIILTLLLIVAQPTSHSHPNAHKNQGNSQPIEKNVESPAWIRTAPTNPNYSKPRNAFREKRGLKKKT